MIDKQKAASLKSGIGKVLRCVHTRQCPPSQPRASLGSLVSPLPASPSSPCAQTPTDVMSVKRESFPIFEFYVNEMIEHPLVSALFLRLNIIISRFIYDVAMSQWLNYYRLFIYLLKDIWVVYSLQIKLPGHPAKPSVVIHMQIFICIYAFAFLGGKT